MPTTRHPVSRRQFVRGAAALGAAAAAGFPTIIPSSALGNAGRAAPSERLNLAVIGLGKQGWGHHLNGKLVGRRDTQLVGLCDVYKPRLEAAKKKVEDTYAQMERKDYKGCQTWDHYKDVLAHPGLDAVLIATPDHWHTAIAIEACKAKKDIYCEKPLTLTIGEAKALIDCVRKYERVFQVGSQQRSEGPFREIAEMVRNGRIGNVKEVHVALGGVSSQPCDLPGEEAPETLDWDQWLGQAPKRPYNERLCRKGMPDSYPFNPGWREFSEYSGGYVTDWGAHHFDIVQWALDQDKAGPSEIRPPEEKGAKYGASFVYAKTPVGDNVRVTHMEKVASPDGRQENNGILFVGEKGTIFVNRGKKVSKPESAIAAESNGNGDSSSSGNGHVTLFKSPGHHNNWYECIKTRERPICDVEVGSRSVTVCHLVNLAYWNGQKLQWDPQKWEFTGSNADEANKWRNRERRAGYELPTF